MKRMTVLLACILVLCFSNPLPLAKAESFGLNLDSMSKADLETIIDEARSAIERNHEVSYDVSSSLESRLKVDVIQNMPGLVEQPDWHIFGGWKYSREWNSLTVSTEAKVNGQWLPVEAVYNEESAGNYQLMFLSVDGQAYVEKRGGTPAEVPADEASEPVAAEDREPAEQEDSQPSEDDANGGKRAEAIIAYKGEKSSAVEDIQSMLIRLGFLNGKADGDFGAKTEAAVMEFQRKYGLEATGIVMESDLLAMQEAVAAIPVPTPTPEPTATPVPVQYISISAEKLNDQYLENEVAADQKYKKQILRVSGKVFKVDKQEHLFSGPTYIVSLDTGDFSFYTITCEFDSSHEGSVSKLKKGSKVTIQGTCIGKYINVNLEDCQIVN